MYIYPGINILQDLASHVQENCKQDSCFPYKTLASFLQMQESCMQYVPFLAIFLQDLAIFLQETCMSILQVCLPCKNFSVHSCFSTNNPTRVLHGSCKDCAC